MEMMVDEKMDQEVDGVSGELSSMEINIYHQFSKIFPRRFRRT